MVLAFHRQGIIPLTESILSHGVSSSEYDDTVRPTASRSCISGTIITHQGTETVSRTLMKSIVRFIYKLLIQIDPAGRAYRFLRIVQPILHLTPKANREGGIDGGVIVVVSSSIP